MSVDEEQTTAPEPARLDASSETVMATEARAARKGFVFITGAKIWFLLAATLLNIGLPRILGDPALFGDFGVVNTLISILNMVMVTGVIQAVSKRVSERPELAGAIRVAALRLQGVLGGLVFVALFFGADLLAESVLKDATLAPLIRIAAIVTFAYAFYGALIGVINGLKRFGAQAVFDVGYATAKVGLIILLVNLGFGVSGAFAGFAAAAVTVAIVAAVYLRRECPVQAGGSERFDLLAFMLPVMGYVLFMNLLLQADVLVVKAAAWEPVAAALGAGEAGWIELVRQNAPDAEGDVLVAAGTSFFSGLFKATKNIALVPYQGVVAITFVIFPLISRATFEEDADATRVYVTQALRVTLLLVAFVVTGIAAGGSPLLELLFGDAYGLAAGALMPLLVAMGLFSALYVVASVLTAAGKPRDALVLMAVMSIALVVILHRVVSDSVAGPELLERAAWAVLVVTTVAWIGASVDVRWRLGVSIPWLTFGRAVAAGAIGVLATGGIGADAAAESYVVLTFLLARCALAGVIFLGVLALTRELGKSDLQTILSTLRLRRSS